MNYEYYDKIDAYLKGELSDLDKKLFEKELKTDQDLKLLVKHYDTMVDLLEVAAQEKVDKIRLKVKSKIKTKRIKPTVMTMLIRKPLIAAASILLLIIAGCMTYANFNYTSEVLAKQAYSSLADLTNQGDLGDSQDQIVLFPQMPVDLRNQYAHSLIRQENYTEARVQFEQIIESGDPRFVEGAEYYLAVCYLFEGDRKVAEDILERIAQSNAHNQAGRSRQLLRRLNGFWNLFVIR